MSYNLRIKKHQKLKTKTMQRRLKKISGIKLSLIVGLLLSFMLPAVTFANGSLNFILKNPDPYTGNKSWFIYERKPGDFIEDTAIIKNTSGTDMRAKIYAVDATSNESGKFILKLEKEKRENLGVWTSVSQNEIIVPPFQMVEVPFKIQIPKTVTPGQYFGGLVMEESSIESAQTDNKRNILTPKVNNEICCNNIQIKTRIGLRIYLTIPGEVHHKIDWQEFNKKQIGNDTYFTFTISNKGNVAVEPQANIEIYDMLGKSIDRFQQPLGDSLPGTLIKPEIKWEKAPLIGKYKVKAKVNYTIKNYQENNTLHGANQDIMKSLDFWVFPWEIFKVSVAAALVILLAAVIYITKIRREFDNWAMYEVQRDENIILIAKKHHISWKKLARKNHLKSPYVVMKGQELMVPVEKSEVNSRNHEVSKATLDEIIAANTGNSNELQSKNTDTPPSETSSNNDEK